MNLNEIRAREQAATPGPWEWKIWVGFKVIDDEGEEQELCTDVYLHNNEKVAMSFMKYGIAGAPAFPSKRHIMERADKFFDKSTREQAPVALNYINHPNADFIAHAREDIPWLLGEVEHLTHMLEIYRMTRGSLSEYCERLQAEVARLTAERDAAVEDLKVVACWGICSACVHEYQQNNSPCNSDTEKCFAWRGVKGE